MRFPSSCVIGVITCVLGASVPPAAAAQATAPADTPCHLKPCVLVFDWGSGRIAASFGPDRRYGSGDDFEVQLRAALADRGIRTTATPGDGTLSFTLRPTMRPRSMCDTMQGTSNADSSDFSCTAMSDLMVTFVSSDPATRTPSAIRVGNRCGARNNYMTMAQFAQYAAGMVWYTLEGAQQKAPRPAAHC